MRNCEKDPRDWQRDVDRSIKAFNNWYLTAGPREYANARLLTTSMVAKAFASTGQFAEFSEASLRESPEILQIARQACAPPLARDRLASLAGVDRNTVKTLENGKFPRKITDTVLRSIVQTIHDLLDPEIFTWVSAGTKPSVRELDKAIDVLSDRITLAIANPVIRNSQEKRQKALMAEFLASHENPYEGSPLPSDRMLPGTYGFGRNVPLSNDDGSTTNLPVDCVIRTHANGPLLCVEMKSAGDETNVNKRRKEEASKHAGLKRTYGDSATMLLQLFGHFNVSYLHYEARVGLDWFWDHRMSDLSEYL